jgi:hypothetical protein
MSSFPVETVPIEQLRAHPKNYVIHPPDELEHIKASIEAHGIYKNVVIARDSTILAGHGLVEAARQLGLAQLPVIRLDIDPLDPRALQVLTGDNEIMHLRQIDDRALADLFLEIAETAPGGLLGTGYDDSALELLLSQQPQEIDMAAADTPFADFPAVAQDDSFVPFGFGDYRGRVPRVVYDSFVSTYRAMKQESGAPMLGDVLQGWLNV